MEKENIFNDEQVIQNAVQKAFGKWKENWSKKIQPNFVLTPITNNKSFGWFCPPWILTHLWFSGTSTHCWGRSMWHKDVKIQRYTKICCYELDVSLSSSNLFFWRCGRVCPSSLSSSCTNANQCRFFVASSRRVLFWIIIFLRTNTSAVHGEFAKRFPSLKWFYPSGGATLQDVEGVRYCHDQVKSWCDCQDVGEEAGTLIVDINIFLYWY